MKAFVTGASGFIGSHLCEALARAGHEVTGLARDKDSPRWLREVDLKVNKVWGDVRSERRMAELIAGHDVVFHLAALRDVAESFEIPEVYVGTNYWGTRAVAAAARAAGAKLVHTSSSEVYGSAQYTPMDEAHRIWPQSPYAESKAMADMHVIQESHRGLNATILRPFNTYGPRQATRGVLAHIIERAVAGEPVPLGNVNAKRDWLYVDDTVAAFMCAAEIDEIGPLNAGTERAVSVYRAAEMIFDIIHPPNVLHTVLPDATRERGDAEVDLLRADASKLRAHGWSHHVPLEEGLARTVDWWRERGRRAA